MFETKRMYQVDDTNYIATVYFELKECISKLIHKKNNTYH